MIRKPGFSRYRIMVWIRSWPEVPEPVPGRDGRQVKARLLDFVNCLREAKFDVGIPDAAQMGMVLQELERPDLTATKTAFRTLCCRSHDDWLRFNPVFNEFWLPRDDPALAGEPDSNPESQPTRRGGISGIGGVTEQQSDLYDPGKGAGAGAGKQNTVSQADFRFLNDRSAMRRVEHLAEQLASSIRPRLSRRRKLSNRGRQLALRHTFRKSVSTGGEPLKTWKFRRKPEPRDLVILHDVSHSMTFNNPLLIRFTRGLARRLKTSEVFVFHTRLFPATAIFREKTLYRMREALEGNNRLWLGGTCIADSLLEFRENHAGKILNPGSIVMIISDGFDSNNPGQLASELKGIKSPLQQGCVAKPDA